MPLTQSDAEAYFRDYAQALVSRDPERIAGFWGVPGLVLSDQGAIPVSERSAVVGFFASSMDQYEGLDGAVAEIVHFAEISAEVCAADIRWHHLSRGEETGEETGHYLLRRHADRILIHVYSPHMSGS